MANSVSESPLKDNPHLEESVPREWMAYEIEGEQLIAHDRPEAVVALYRVLGPSRIIRSFASADAALYNGHVVNTYYDNDIKTVEFVHEYAGRTGSHRVDEYLSHPALKLEKLPASNGFLTPNGD